MTVRKRCGWNRRSFLREVARYGSTGVLATRIGRASAYTNVFAEAQARNWKNDVGLELFTVRDLLAKNFEGTLERIAAIGYKLVETSVGYNDMPPMAFRAMLDRHGLTMPSSYTGASGSGAALEKQLEGLQIMGVRYTQVAANGGAGRGGASEPPQTIELVKRQADRLNANGKVVAKFEMKLFIHNHTIEFAPLDDGKTTAYDVLLAATDPAFVTMQLDIGWASVAGQDILGMFKRTPGRFELWHVKDMFGIKGMDPKMPQADRRRAAMMVPIGRGEIDYRTIFGSAELAGLKHYFIEQDNAAAWGDSLAAARVSYEDVTARVLA